MSQILYKALLHCYPAAFRDEYGHQMQLMFAEQLSEARRRGTRREQAALWIQATRDALTIAPKEHCHVIHQDLRYAFRTMAARPGFTAVAILSLALGIGANTAIFSLWNGVLHSFLPAVERPEELAILTNPNEEGAWHGNITGVRDWISYAEFEQLRDQSQSFSGLMASQSGLGQFPIRVAGGDWEKASARLVSGGFFQVLGVKPLMGRVFTVEDDHAALPHAVISYNYWQHRFGGSLDVLGKTLTLSKTALTIIGVAPRGFIGETAGQQPDFWMPLRMQTSVVQGEDYLHETPPEKIMWLHAFGRLKPGVTLERAGAEANTIFKTGLKSFYGNVSPEQRRELFDQRLQIQSASRGASKTRNDFSTSLTALMCAVGLLLLIACANLANLLLARGAARKSEMALRLSLGASRGRLVRQLFTESLLLAIISGVAGIAVAYSLHGALARMIAQSDERFRMSFTLNPVALLFTLTITLAAALLFGLLPAWRVTKSDSGAVLKEKSRMGWGRSLVSLQLALSVPLLVGAGLLVRTLYNLQHSDFGYPAEHLLLASGNLREITSDAVRRERLLRDLLTQFQQIHGVRSASFSELGVFSGGNSLSGIEVEGFASKQDSDRHSALDRVGPGYFSALGDPLTMGREILERDHAGAPKVCVINKAFADKFFAGRNPIGMHVTSIGDTQRTVYQIVGVAKNARTQSLREQIEPRYFIAAEQDLSSLKYPVFLIRTFAETAPVLAAITKSIKQVNAAAPLLSVKSIEERMAPLTAQDRATAQLVVVFGSVALTLAAIGLYGVLSFSIVRRTREIAVRIALGAHPGRVISMILRETSGLVVIGLTAGAVLAYGASRLIHGRLYGVAPQDPLTLASATVLLLFVALSAAYLPARRASRLDPMAALRRD